MENTFTVYQGDKLIAENVSAIEAMDYVWSELNTEETPIRIIDSRGHEIEW